MVLGQSVALEMVNKLHMKFQKICFNTFKVIAKVKVCQNDDNDNDNNDDDTDTDTRVITIPQLFVFKNQAAELK